MAQFEVYQLRGSDALLVDCQTNFLSHLPTRFVVPLLPASEAPDPAERFNPLLRLKDKDFYFSPQFAANVRLAELRPAGVSLHNEYEAITAALDFLIGGF